MPEEFVKREEFNILRKDVDKIKEEMSESSKTLQAIERKIDVITERLGSSDKIDELKINPLEKRITKLEDNQTWLWRAFGTALVGVLVKVVFDVSTYVK